MSQRTNAGSSCSFAVICLCERLRETVDGTAENFCELPGLRKRELALSTELCVKGVLANAKGLRKLTLGGASSSNIGTDSLFDVLQSYPLSLYSVIHDIYYPLISVIVNFRWFGAFVFTLDSGRGASSMTSAISACIIGMTCA